jgi:tetratricopeptide (TPR) repeat protein
MALDLDHWKLRTKEAPDSAVAHFNLGLAYTQRGMMESAQAAYRRSLDLDPDMVEAWVNLGGVLLLQWDFAGSLEANRQAVARKEDSFLAQFNMGQAHLYLGDAEGVVRCNRRALELSEEHAAAHYYLAVGLLATGGIEQARSELAIATRLGHRPSPEFLAELERAQDRAAPRAEAPARKAPEKQKEV